MIGMRMDIKRMFFDTKAVKAAVGSIKEGSVLLSPGYASFDMFRNYRERGAKFKEVVYSLSS